VIFIVCSETLSLTFLGSGRGQATVLREAGVVMLLVCASVAVKG